MAIPIIDAFRVQIDYRSTIEIEREKNIYIPSGNSQNGAISTLASPSVALENFKEKVV